MEQKYRIMSLSSTIIQKKQVCLSSSKVLLSGSYARESYTDTSNVEVVSEEEISSPEDSYHRKGYKIAALLVNEAAAATPNKRRKSSRIFENSRERLNNCNRSSKGAIQKRSSARRPSYAAVATPSMMNHGVNVELESNRQRCGESPTRIRRVSSSFYEHEPKDTSNTDKPIDVYIVENQPYQNTYDAHPNTTMITSTTIARGGVACPFPWKLHDMLDYCTKMTMEPEFESSTTHSKIVTWNDTGTAFAVLNTKVFVQTILPRFFAQTKYASFQRQLNLYGFTRVAIPSISPQTNSHSSRASSASMNMKNYSYYSHPYFIRGQRDSVRFMVRCKIKGTGKKRTNDEDHFNPTHHEFGIVPTTSGSDDEEDGGREIDDDNTFDDTETYDTKQDVDCAGAGDDLLVKKTKNSMEPTTFIQDGELLYFEGSPFHFLNPRQATVDDMTLSREATVSPMLMLPPPFKVDLDDDSTDNPTQSYGWKISPMQQRTALLDCEYVDYVSTLNSNDYAEDNLHNRESYRGTSYPRDKFLMKFPLLDNSTSKIQLKPISENHIAGFPASYGLSQTNPRYECYGNHHNHSNRISAI